MVLVPTFWIHKTLQHLSCSYWCFPFPKLFFSLIFSGDLIRQRAAIWRVNDRLWASDASMRQHSSSQCFVTVMEAFWLTPTSNSIALGSSRARWSCQQVYWYGELQFSPAVCILPTVAVVNGAMPSKVGCCRLLLFTAIISTPKLQRSVFTQQPNRFDWTEESTINPFGESLEGGWKVVVQVLYHSFVFTPLWLCQGNCGELLLFQR